MHARKAILRMISIAYSLVSSSVVSSIMVGGGVVAMVQPIHMAMKAISATPNRIGSTTAHRVFSPGAKNSHSNPEGAGKNNQ